MPPLRAAFSLADDFVMGREQIPRRFALRNDN
jgi:hypothetical protein